MSKLKLLIVWRPCMLSIVLTTDVLTACWSYLLISFCKHRPAYWVCSGVTGRTRTTRWPQISISVIFQDRTGWRKWGVLYPPTTNCRLWLWLISVECGVWSYQRLEAIIIFPPLAGLRVSDWVSWPNTIRSDYSPSYSLTYPQSPPTTHHHINLQNIILSTRSQSQV